MSEEEKKVPTSQDESESRPESVGKEKVEEAEKEEAVEPETEKASETPATEKAEEIATEAPEAKEAPEDKKEKPEPTGKFKELITEIENLSVLELSELVKALEERFGVSAAALTVAAPTSGAQGAPTESVGEEKSSYDVILASSGDKKIQVIKAVREIKPDLGLKEAKDLVDGAPKELLKGAKKEDAEEAKTKLEAAGATVELK